MIEKIKKIWRGEVENPKMFGINCIAMEFIFVGLTELITALYLKNTQHTYTMEQREQFSSFLFSLTFPVQILMLVGIIKVIKRGDNKKGSELSVINALWLVPAFYIVNTFNL